MAHEHFIISWINPEKHPSDMKKTALDFPSVRCTMIPFIARRAVVFPFAPFPFSFIDRPEVCV